MAKFILETYDASPSYGGGYSIALNLGGDGPFPPIPVEARNVEDALKQLHDHAQHLATLGKPLATSIRLARNERAPKGWRKLAHRQTTIPVNVPGIPA